MKLVIYLFICILFYMLLLLHPVSAQIPNSSFETWVIDSEKDIPVPDEWSFYAVNNDLLQITRSDTSYADSFSVRGEVISTGLQYPNDRISPTLISKPMNSDNIGFAVSEQYTNIAGYYQFYPRENDRFYITVLMMSGYAAVGYGTWSTLDSKITWLQFSIDINYYIQRIPTTCIISVMIVGSDTTTKTNHVGSYYLIDDFSIIKNSSGVEVINGEQVARPVFSLEQNYPNPFNPETTIGFQIFKNENVNLTIYNIIGEQVTTLIDDYKNIGYHHVTWNGLNDIGQKVPSGVYLYRIQVGSIFQTKKMILVN